MNRAARRTLLPWSGISLGLVAALAQGCGGESEVYMGSMPRAGTGGATAQGGAGGTLIGAGRGGTGGSTGGTAGSGVTGGTGGGETCGGVPCADHTGVVDFIDGDTPPDAGDTFGSGTTHDAGSDTM